MAFESHELDLRRQNEEILSAVGEGIYGLDIEGRVTFVNPAAERLTGHTDRELLGQSMHELIHHSHADGCAFERVCCPIYAALHDGTVHRADDQVFWRRDGTAFPVRYTSTPIHRDGKIAGAVVAFQDITEEKRAQVDLHAALHEVRALKEQLQARNVVLQEHNVYLKEEIERAGDFGQIVGRSPALRGVLEMVEQVASSDATVLILGESGTGKELFARAVHELSPRRSGPLVKVNCAAMSSALVESELFGHERGAFTDACQRRLGRFELANGGTIFLDEVGELPLPTQAKLLRVLQEREVERVGGSRPIQLDVRIVAATNRDLRAAVERGEFRLDLYYRLDVLRIAVPPLRERKEDIPLLVGACLKNLRARMGRDLRGITQESMDGLLAYDWPGNVRELQNVIERAAILARGPIVSVQGLRQRDPARLRELARLPGPNATSDRPSDAPAANTADDARAGVVALEAAPDRAEATLAESERAHILRTLERVGWKVAGARGAGEALGLHPNTLRSRMKRLGIRRG